MSTSSGPDHDDRDALSAWERRVLAGIEDDLALGPDRRTRCPLG